MVIVRHQEGFKIIAMKKDDEVTTTTLGGES
jgi:hypothetical protein